MYADLKAAYDEAYADFCEENRLLIEVLEDTKGEVERFEEGAREAALVHYEKTGQKTLDYGFTVGVYKTHQYDERQAITYCVEHSLKIALKLNKATFKKLLDSEVIEHGGCQYTIGEEPRARIAKDLGKHLPTE
jgi:hypothetical protein